MAVFVISHSSCSAAGKQSALAAAVEDEGAGEGWGADAELVLEEGECLQLFLIPLDILCLNGNCMHSCFSVSHSI